MNEYAKKFKLLKFFKLSDLSFSISFMIKARFGTWKILVTKIKRNRY